LKADLHAALMAISGYPGDSFTVGCAEKLDLKNGCALERG